MCSVCEKEIAPVLKTMTEDDDPDVRYFSEEALVVLGESK